MKYTSSLYAKALAAVIVEKGSAGDKEKDLIVRRFLSLVRRSGDDVHLRKIVEEAARFVRGKRGVRKVTLATARQLSPAQRKMLKAFQKGGDVVEEVIDPELVAGVKIIIDDEAQFDGSFKGKLDKLFIA